MNIINVNFLKIRDISEQLISLMLRKNPNCHYTVFVTLWEDNTFMIVCRNGEPKGNGMIIYRDYRWYENKISYKEYEVPHRMAVSEDE